MEGEVMTKKENGWKWATFALVIVLVAVVAYMVGSRGSIGTGNVINPDDGDVPTQPSKVDVDDDAVLGDKDAKVTIIEFSDYQCPFCRKFWTETYSQIKSEYIDTGKVKIVFRDFPLTGIHPAAQKSAEAAECVREKGGDSAYWKYHDKMFSE
ncbi:MAG: DsbA family protein, partial [Nanoarchaeota archaeon]